VIFLEILNESESGDISILLLGGSSFLGLQTAQTLFYYFDITCTYFRSKAHIFFPEFNWFQVNFLEQNKEKLKASLERLIEKSNCKYLVNFVAVSSPLEAKNDRKTSKIINVDANKLIVEVCERLKIIPIFLSSDHVFNGENGPYSEIEIPNPLKNSVYGNQKAKAEKIYQKLEKYAIIRISTTLGTNLHFQNQNIYEKTLEHLTNNKKILGATNKIRSASHCYNVAFLINKIIESFELEKITREIFHLPGEIISEYELMKKIAKTHKLDQSLVVESTIDNDNYSYPLSLGLKSDETVALVQGRFLNLDECLKLLYGEFE
jgi:dTDP-4-dehydrorhamnose reductase